MFITFEGIDGSGKTTQSTLLKKYFESLGKDVALFRDPGSTKISEKLREILLDKNNTEISKNTEMLIYAAARAQMVDELIKPALKKDTIVICDRYIDSSLVYQGIVRGIGTDKVLSVNKIGTSNLLPDITFLIDIDNKTSLNRKEKQQELDRMEILGNDFHTKVRNGFLEISNKDSRIKVINGDDLVDNIHKAILDIIKKEMII